MPTTLDEALKWAQRQLEAAGISTARLDALVLLEDLSGANRAKILAEPKLTLTSRQYTHYQQAIQARTKHVPLAYIRQKTEFYGRDFFVDSRVLEPRPESEAIIDELLKLRPDTKKVYTIIDVGTGSGALIITAKLEVPGAKAIAIDIDRACLGVARHNANAYNCPITFIRSNLISQVPEAVFQTASIIIANLPYVPNDWHINRSAGHEPARAIFGGKTGLELYERLFEQLSQLQTKPEFIITESLPPQHEALTLIARQHNYGICSDNDFVQVFSYSEPRQV